MGTKPIFNQIFDVWIEPDAYFLTQSAVESKSLYKPILCWICLPESADFGNFNGLNEHRKKILVATTCCWIEIALRKLHLSVGETQMCT